MYDISTVKHAEAWKGIHKASKWYLRVSGQDTTSVYSSGIVKRLRTLETELWLFYLLHGFMQIALIYRLTVSLSLNFRQ